MITEGEATQDWFESISLAYKHVLPPDGPSSKEDERGGTSPYKYTQARKFDFMLQGSHTVDKLAELLSASLEFPNIEAKHLVIGTNNLMARFEEHSPSQWEGGRRETSSTGIPFVLLFIIFGKTVVSTLAFYCCFLIQKPMLEALGYY